MTNWYVKRRAAHETRFLTAGGNWTPSLELARRFDHRWQAEQRASRCRPPIVAEVHRQDAVLVLAQCKCREWIGGKVIDGKLVGGALKIEDYCPVHGTGETSRLML